MPGLKLAHKPISRQEMSQRQKKILEAYDKEVTEKKKEVTDLTGRKRQLELDAQIEVGEKEKKVTALKIDITNLKIQLANKEAELLRVERKP